MPSPSGTPYGAATGTSKPSGSGPGARVPRSLESNLLWDSERGPPTTARARSPMPLLGRTHAGGCTGTRATSRGGAGRHPDAPTRHAPARSQGQAWVGRLRALRGALRGAEGRERERASVSSLTPAAWERCFATTRVFPLCKLPGTCSTGYSIGTTTRQRIDAPIAQGGGCTASIAPRECILELARRPC